MPKTIHRLEMDDAELVRLRNSLIGYDPLGGRRRSVRCRYCQGTCAPTIAELRHADSCAFPVLDKMVQDAGLDG